MTSRKRIAVSITLSSVLLGPTGLAAQGKQRIDLVTRSGQDTVDGFNYDSAPVKGLPYSAEGITTVKLSMFDGTKVERTVTAKFFRDSAGRTRREQTVVGLEALDPSNDFRAVVQIVDPVAGVLYTLNPGDRTAHRLSLSQLQGNRRPASVPLEYAKNEEGLGVKDIDGVAARGTRSTTTVPRDRVGNDRPIDIIDERWESVELKVLLRSLHRDPRSGDIEYALTKISRAEPAASLFQVPSGYTIRDLPAQR